MTTRYTTPTTIAIVGEEPRALAVSALVVALALLVESFGRDVWWLWQHRAGVDRADQIVGESVAHQTGRVA